MCSAAHTATHQPHILQQFKKKKHVFAQISVWHRVEYPSRTFYNHLTKRFLIALKIHLCYIHGEVHTMAMMMAQMNNFCDLFGCFNVFPCSHVFEHAWTGEYMICVSNNFKIKQNVIYSNKFTVDLMVRWLGCLLYGVLCFMNVVFWLELLQDDTHTHRASTECRFKVNHWGRSNGTINPTASISSPTFVHCRVQIEERAMIRIQQSQQTQHSISKRTQQDILSALFSSYFNLHVIDNMDK